MSKSVTSQEFAQQFGKAIRMLLDWIELKENSRMQSQPKSFDNEGYEMEILTPNEVANMLKVSRSSAYQMIRQGKIPSVRIGRSVRDRKVDLDKYIADSSIN